jgi:hypothetical protein
VNEKPQGLVRVDGTVAETHGNTRHGEGCACTKCVGFQHGHTLSLKHGAYANVAISPRADELATLVRETAPVYEPCDEPAVRALGVILARIERAEMALADVDEGLDAASADPLAGYVGRTERVDALTRLRSDLRSWLAVAERYFAALGLTPGSRARLGVDIAKARRLTVVELHAQAAIEGESVEETS